MTVANDSPRWVYMPLADDSSSTYNPYGMEHQKTLSAAATLDAFTIELLARLSGEDEAMVEMIVRSLLQSGRIAVRSSQPRRVKNRYREYTWTVGGEMATRAQVRAADARSDPAEIVSSGRDVEPFEDPFASALAMAREWIEEAEASSSEQVLSRHLSMARAEIRTLRRYLHGQPAEIFEEIEELARRVEILAGRPPIEAFRSRIRKSVFDAIRNAANHVPLTSVRSDTETVDPAMAFVFDATQSYSGAASAVSHTLEQIGGSCVIFQMAQATPRRRQLALEALGPFFTGPGSAKTKVFIIIDSASDARSRKVLRELVSYFDSADRLADMLAGDRDAADGSRGWTFEPSLFLSSISTPSNDWLPRGVLKHYLLHSYLEHAAPRQPQDLARVALNDPVIFDCVSAGPGRVQEQSSSFSYHRVDIDPALGAVIRGLVRGSFAGTVIGGSAEESRDIRLLSGT